ncbi:MAG TPA: type IV toxin-antitoxin system AbiEi family antitoxin domain-containing protein, partial [Cryobacterium sp.]|nr:type IV toxin-antitoxin system AbiEi family antitoxin domain-containing protein [Cryobacterium sp.]
MTYDAHGKVQALALEQHGVFTAGQATTLGVNKRSLVTMAARGHLENLPPKTGAAMTEAIRICGDKLHQGSDWVRRWIAFTIVGDALATYGPAGDSYFEFTGGA